MNRMILKKLIVSGAAKKDAILEFKEGLNIITGDSDTGKTYAFQCLNYILGGEKEPKSIPEAKGYEKISLAFIVDEKQYVLERNIGDNKVVARYDDKIESLYYKHDAVKDDNLSRFMLKILSQSTENIQVRKNAKNDKRTLSFRDLIHLCMIDETDIIAESSAFQSEQYTEKTVRSSIFKFIISGKDDSSILSDNSNGDESIRRAGVVQFLENKKISLLKKINEIENNQYYKLYSTSNTLGDMILKINALRNAISEINSDCIKKEAEVAELNKECFVDELKIKDFESVYSDYLGQLNKNGVIETYADFLAQVPQLDCPVCGKKFGEETNFNDDKFEELFLYFEKQSKKLQQKVEGVKETIIDVKERLKTNQAKIKELQNQINKAKEKVKNLQVELSELNKNITVIRQLDAMEKTLEVYKQELIEIESNIVSYSEKVKKDKKMKTSVDSSIFKSYCDEVYKILNQWGFNVDGTVSLDPTIIDITLGENSRTSWGKGYRAFVMSAMTIALMRFCFNNSRLHPGFVVLDSPLVSLKERKLDNNNEWVSDYMERKMVENIYTEDCLHQVIIFENKELKYELDFNYVEFAHEGKGRKGFIPQQEQ